MLQSSELIISQKKKTNTFHVQAGFGTAFVFLTSGVFLSGLAMLMGASDLLVSYISMITNICGVSILFFSSFMERLGSYKKAAIWLTAISKAATLMIVLIPLLIPDNWQIPVFITLMVAAFTLQAQTTVVLNNWMVSFVDEKESGRYIARRQTIVLAVTVVLSLSGGRLLDTVSGAYIGFAILFFAALLMAVAEVFVLMQIPDVIRQKTQHKKCRLRDMICVPVKSRPFLYFVLYIVLFYLLLSLSDSFTVVYMMRYLKLNFITTTAMQMLLSLPQIVLLGIWGKISDRKGHRFVLTSSIWFFAGETFFLALSDAQNFYILLPTAFLFAAAANSGFIVSVFNRRYELMPSEGRILYDNFYSAAIGLAFILGPLAGGAIKGLIEKNSWVETAVPFGNIRLLYLVSTIGIVVMQICVCVSRRLKE